MKIVKLSDISQNISPVKEKWLKLFVKMLSICVVMLEVSLVECVIISGKTFLNTSVISKNYPVVS